MAYAVFIGWLFVRQPQTIAQVAGGLSAAVGTYSVDLLTTDRTVPLGTIQVTDGKGSLGAVADVDLATAKSVRLIEGDGHVLYEAVFKPLSA